MSVTIGRTWRDAQALREGKKVAERWLVTVFFRFDDGTVVRDRTVVGEGTATPIRTERLAKEWGEKRERELFAKGPPTKGALIATSEKVSEWFGRYYAAAERGEVGKKNQGKPQASVRDRRDRFRVWLEESLGHLRMAEVTAEHLRGVVRMLDEQVRRRIRFYEEGEGAEREERGGKLRKPGISAKTAAHIWSEVTSGFKEALSSKIDDLRVITVSPLVGVQPPIRTKPREQEALFPSEVIQLLSCEAIPLPRRRVYAVAIYTGMRRSELERLEAADIDFEHERITVRGSKTDAAYREVPIEPALLPLLRILVKERKSGPLLDVPSGQGSNGTADLMKLDLERAKLTRAALYRDDAHVMPFNFHGTRHTAITHWAVAGKSQLFLLTVCGHLDVTMTRRYLGKAASVSAKFGTPHPPLPASVLGGAKIVHLPSAKRTA
jgi:integrase